VSDFHVNSFDTPRDRSVPQTLRGRSLIGEEITVDLVGLTLIVAVKPNCDGCHDFIHGDLHELVNVHVIVVCATRGDQEWDSALQTVVVAPEFMAELDLRSAPYYVLIDPASSRVLGEGALFSSAQVASEIASFLTL
jgi:hypothetical protein